MNHTIYWLWVQHVFGAGGAIAGPLSAFPSVQAFYEADEQAYLSRAEYWGGGLTKARLTRLAQKDLSPMRQTIELCERHEIGILTPDDPDYPARLLELPDYPAALFIRGDASCLSAQHTVAIIGSRHPTVYAFNAATRISASLAQEGFLIVSGGALGIDSAGHSGALQAKQKTVLVMGCGHLNDYLKTNLQIREVVANNGALISEFQPTEEPSKFSFPVRNRLISGLSEAVVIMEAADKSGTFNTARHAQEQGRKLFVFPGDCVSPAFSGSRRLIREGATVVFSASDIAYHLGVWLHEAPADAPKTLFEGIDRKETRLSDKRTGSGPKKSAVRRAAEPVPNEPVRPAMQPAFDPQSVSKTAALVYQSILDGCTLFDEICLTSKLTGPQALAALTELELVGAVRKEEGNRYAVKV